MDLSPKRSVKMTICEVLVGLFITPSPSPRRSFKSRTGLADTDPGLSDRKARLRTKMLRIRRAQ